METELWSYFVVALFSSFLTYLVTNFVKPPTTATDRERLKHCDSAGQQPNTSSFYNYFDEPESKLAPKTVGEVKKPQAYLVGAGPGDPSLLTVAAMRVLKTADLVITDRLVSQGILDICKGRIVYSQKFKGCANVAQAQLQDWVIDGLKQGLVVVRLKGGDPFLYGRGMEEVEHILRFGYRVKVIPGISSSLAGPLAAGLSITARNIANKVLIATAHGKYDTYPDIPPYDPSRSTVYLMSVSRLSNLAKALVEKGYPSDLPVSVIEKATTPAQRSVRARLVEIGETATREKISSPAIIVIGRAAMPPDALIEYSDGGTLYKPCS